MYVLFLEKQLRNGEAGRLTQFFSQVFLKKLFYTPSEIEEFIKLADSDQSGEVQLNPFYAITSHFFSPKSFITLRSDVRGNPPQQCFVEHSTRIALHAFFRHPNCRAVITLLLLVGSRRNFWRNRCPSKSFGHCGARAAKSGGSVTSK
jgi:hypothetical protein